MNQIFIKIYRLTLTKFQTISKEAIYLSLIISIFSILSVSCMPDKTSYLKKVANDFETTGFLTYDIFQATCTIHLTSAEQELLAGKFPRKKAAKAVDENSGIEKIKFIHSRFLEECQNQTLLALVQTRLEMENKDNSIEVATSFTPLFEQFFPGKLVYEKREASILYGTYRIIQKNLLYSVINIKISEK